MLLNSWLMNQERKIKQDIEKDGSWRSKIEFQGREVDVDINVDSDDDGLLNLKKLGKILNKFSFYHQASIEALERNYEDGSDEYGVSLYVEHHDEFEGKTSTEDVLQILKMDRIGFYPGNDDEFMIVDFSIGRDITNYLVMIAFDYTLKIQAVRMES